MPEHEPKPSASALETDGVPVHDHRCALSNMQVVALIAQDGSTLNEALHRSVTIGDCIAHTLCFGRRRHAAVRAEQIDDRPALMLDSVGFHTDIVSPLGFRCKPSDSRLDRGPRLLRVVAAPFQQG
jgi:hypothetical protein